MAGHTATPGFCVQTIGGNTVSGSCGRVAGRCPLSDPSGPRPCNPLPARLPHPIASDALCASSSPGWRGSRVECLEDWRGLGRYRMATRIPPRLASPSVPTEGLLPPPHRSPQRSPCCDGVLSVRGPAPHREECGPACSEFRPGTAWTARSEFRVPPRELGLLGRSRPLGQAMETKRPTSQHASQ